MKMTAICVQVYHALALLAAVVCLAAMQPVSTRLLQQGTETMGHADDSEDAVTSGYLQYNLTGITDFDALIELHRDKQQIALQEGLAGHLLPNAILVETKDSVGLGNRLPSIAVGFVMALFTKRVFLVDSSILQHLDLPHSCKWNDYASIYQKASRCDMKTYARQFDWMRLSGADLDWCAGARNATLLTYDSIDYDMPFLQVNPALEDYFKVLAPDGAVFHRVARYLFSRPSQMVQQSITPYAAKSTECILGMQLRNRKYAAVHSEQFAKLARAIVQQVPGNIFVASDTKELFPLIKNGLSDDREVWWSSLTIESLSTAVTTAGNPGTELSAVVDMLLLAKCKNIVVTPSSSLGAVAAGLAGVRPFYATFGDHENPFLNPWYWGSVTSEPCCFKLGKGFNLSGPMLDTFKSKYPSLIHQNQCHH